MARVGFDELPGEARLWIFAAGRELAAGERDRLLGEVDGFLEQWTAHQTPLTAARDWRYDRFLLVAVDEAAAGVSGCSIDALTRGIKRLEHELGVALLDRAPVLYRDGRGIARVTRDEFARLADSGTVSPDTLVFDNTVATVGDLRAGRWEGPAAAAWHGRAFFG